MTISNWMTGKKIIGYYIKRNTYHLKLTTLMFDMFNMMNKLKEVQAKVKEAQDNLQFITVTAEAGAGLVKAKVNGQRKLISLDIDDSLLNKEDKEMVSDLIVAAVNKAMDEAGEKAKDELKRHTEGLLPNIPGLDLNNLGL
jgi:DNA-binding YbaB/EbfC family protein